MGGFEVGDAEDDLVGDRVDDVGFVAGGIGLHNADSLRGQGKGQGERKQCPMHAAILAQGFVDDKGPRE